MRKQTRRTGTAGVLLATCVWSAPASAQNVQTYVTVSAGTGYSSNPYLELSDGRSRSSFEAYIQADPVVAVRGATTDLDLKGNLRFGRHFERYGNDWHARVMANAKKRFSERLEANIGGYFSNSRTAELDGILDSPTVLLPDGSLPDFPSPDVSVAGLNTRKTMYGGSGSLSYVISSRDTITVGGGYEDLSFRDVRASDYNRISGFAQYERRLTDSMAILVNGSLSSTNYSLQQAGDTKTYSAMAGVDWKLSQTAKAKIMLGFSRVNIDLPPGLDGSGTALVGEASYCDKLAGGSVCLSASRDTTPSGFNGTTRNDSVSIGYSRDLNERESVWFNVQYSHLNLFLENWIADTPFGSDYYGASASYSRVLGERFRMFITPSVSKVSNGAGTRKPNFAVMVGISKTFGDKN